MRIAYPMRVDAIDKPGGDVLQVRKYIEAGQRSGEDGGLRFEGVLFSELEADLSRFDLIHLTNIDRPVDTYQSFLRAKATGKPVFLSTIHHSYREIERFERQGRGGAIGFVLGSLNFQRLESLRSALRARTYSQLALPTLRMMLHGMRESQREMLTGVDRILVLTEKEKNDILNDFGEIPEDKFLCLRNGMERKLSVPANLVRDIDVCVVGRLEARKNQLAVLRALEHLGVSATFAGKQNANHKSYCGEFEQRIARSKSEYVGELSQGDTMSLMRRSRVHVSASWFEVLSLVDLEAYTAGCAVVSSQCGGTREILGDRAEYVDPGSQKSIEDGVSRALIQAREGSPDSADRQDIVMESWDEVGNRLAHHYRQAIEEKKPNERT